MTFTISLINNLHGIVQTNVRNTAISCMGIHQQLLSLAHNMSTLSIGYPPLNFEPTDYVYQFLNQECSGQRQVLTWLL